MSRTFLIIFFVCVCVAGLCLIAYGLLAGLRRRTGPTEEEKLALGFSGSPERNFEFLDLDMGHEGLLHREKEQGAEQESKPCKIEVV